MIFKMWILLSTTNLNTKGCPKNLFNLKEWPPFFQDLLGLPTFDPIFSSQLLIDQIEKFWCVLDRGYPEFFKMHPTFFSSPFQSGVISK